MHRCLQIPELVTLICNQAVWSDKDGRNTVAALSQTCQLLYEPATNIIWYRILSLKPLVQCIPQEYLRAGSSEDEAALTQALRPHHLKRVRQLAQRVQAFGPLLDRAEDLSDQDPPKHPISHHIYQLLNLVVGSTTLLPNVRDVTLWNLDLNILLFSHLFTNPHITSLTVKYLLRRYPRRDRAYLFGFLNGVGDRFPHLRRLDLTIMIDHLNNSDAVAIAISNALSSSDWRNLSVLHVDRPVPSQCLWDLLKLPSLKNLSVGISPSENVLSSTATSQGMGQRLIPFTLESISISAAHLSMLTAFLHEFVHRGNSLRAIQLKAYRPQQSTPAHWRDLCEGLRARCNVQLVTTLALNDGLDFDESFVDQIPIDNAPDYSVSLDQIGPLLSFSSLRNLNLTAYGTLNLDDSAVEKIAKSFPLIERLRIGRRNYFDLSPRTTPAALITFAEYCPYLEELQIEFDARERVDLIRGNRPEHGLKLKVLNVLRSPIADPGLVAAFLTDVFPGIKLIYWDGIGDDEEDPTHDNWSQVEKLIDVFGMVRRQERHRMLGTTGDRSMIDS